MNSRGLWRLGFVGSVIGLLLLPWGLGSAQGQSATKEFMVVTGEWQWKAKPGEAPVTDRNRGSVTVMTRYTYDPGFLVVNKGDTVVLTIHNLKGDHHIVDIPAFGINEVKIIRGEERKFTFKADKAGLFKIDCKNHVSAEKEGPMVAYFVVLDR
ncbi:MAG: cupredoxin domain-containing protein [Candidatus Rokubacteria bacterium]|nr:cupredoxin domain-containing protein [Candidatus Rokubacteria bacterium]